MNLPTFIVASIIAVIFFVIVFFAVRNRKKGKVSCSCAGGCSGCSANGCCGGNKE